ncbi:hypothetical protein BG011_007596 [Mortierella polycephala]|uniref:Uncharacterized protein n=1 Tax=Mortierella polycephala TaxID=41804 RepID=A0A9P6PPU0_9FUNG|nr:hypothetical protein BG011_007596 [Mortierella polycephala]
MTESIIRNCFAHVPTIPEAMKEILRTNAKDGKDDEMEQLKRELMELYPGSADAFKKQKDFGVPTYLKCCEGKGPTRQLTDIVTVVSSNERFKKYFLPPGSVVLIDEDQEGGDEDDDLSDEDYYLLDSGDGTKDNNEVKSLGVVSSQESGVLEEETDEQILQGLHDAFNLFRAVVSQVARRQSKSSGVPPTPSLSRSIALIF